MEYFSLAAIILCVDTWSKKKIQKELPLGQSKHVKGRFWLWHRENTGVAYSHFSKKPQTIICATSVLSGGIGATLYHMQKQGGHPMTKVGLACLLGGAVGNLLDRLSKGSVTDFLYVKMEKWPIFNLADVSILFGTLLILFSPGRKG